MYRARYRRIIFFFARILLSVLFWDILLRQLGFGRWAKANQPARFRRYAGQFRTLAIQMGGVLIKVGQFLSTRVDVLPPEFVSELSDLQDEVPPVDIGDVRKVAEGEFGLMLEQKFTSFDPFPLGSASLGQVHRARIGERPVVVKIQRPDIETIITIDLKALRTVGAWLKRYRPLRRRANVDALLDEFSRTLYQEIDYLTEGKNAETFAGNFTNFPGIRVPEVVWTHTTRRALTLENVWAIKITDYAAIEAAGIDRAEVASRLLKTYLKQIFEDGFFHADPHPGNLFVDPVIPSGDENDQPAQKDGQKTAWQLTFIDFGMVGHVPTNLRSALRELLIGVGTQDARRVIKAYQLMGILLPTADLSLMELATARLFERFWGKSMTELMQVDIHSMRDFIGEFQDLLYTMPFQIPQDLIFLGRAVSILSGMCTGLNPNFNVWEQLAPYAKQLIAAETTGNLPHWFGEVGELARILLSLPRKLETSLGRLERGELTLRTPDITTQTNRLEAALQQVTGGLIFLGCLLGGVLLFMYQSLAPAIILFIGAGLSLLWILIIGQKYRR